MAVCGLADDYTTQSKNAQHDFTCSQTPLSTCIPGLYSQVLCSIQTKPRITATTPPLCLPLAGRGEVRREVGGRFKREGA